MSFNEPTLIRLILVVVLALAVRQLIMRLGTKAIDKRREKERGEKQDRKH